MRTSCKCGGERFSVEARELSDEIMYELVRHEAPDCFAFFQCNTCKEFFTQRRRSVAQMDTPRLRATTIEIAETLLASLEEFSLVLRNALEQLKRKD